jgi:anti-sigma regulatory factor (Ser/Thr protein kinase)/Fe-S-cluster-containing hydrogenase component 2
VEHLAYDIQSGDFGRAGAASRDLKQHLKRIGAESNAVRRAMIAAYEAEMNVVIHTTGGRLEATVSDGQLDVDVVDRGPGIPDVPQAMCEGFSTASPEARALGFGAGMGLPNIERNSDRLRVTSAVGEGTRVSFSILLRPEAADQGARPSSLGIAAELCRDCRHCLVACPTAAVRVREARPSVLHHLCVDCTCCIAACDPGALTLLDAPDGLVPGTHGLLAVPPALLAGFGDHAVDTVLEELRGLGFAEVVSVHPYEDELRRGVLELAATSALPAPVISPVCPAVVSLIEVKFPSLVPHLAPLASPWEALQRDLGERDVTYVVSCPSQRTALLAQQATAQRRTVTPRLVREAVLPRLAARRRAAQGTRAPLQQAAGADDLLVVTGVSHVLAVLEEIEDGRLTDVASVEPFICDDGCFGSPLLGEDAYVAAWRWAAAAGAAPGEGRSYERARPYRPRPGIRLDPDMAIAIRKLAELEAETRALAGKDCGVCGAPTCAALAEDIVMGRAVRALCPYVTAEEESPS